MAIHISSLSLRTIDTPYRSSPTLVPRVLQIKSGQEATPVSISASGKAAASNDNSQPTASPGIDSSLEAVELMKNYDFHSITPNQLTRLAVELFRRNEISQDVANSFLNVEMNTVVEMDPEKPIDMEAHFERMLAAAHEITGTDATSNFAVNYRKQASAALSRLMKIAE